MDVSEKKKKLEALRAAREAKQRIVDQYTTSPTASAPKAAVAGPVAPTPPHPQASPTQARGAATASTSAPAPARGLAPNPELPRKALAAATPGISSPRPPLPSSAPSTVAGGTQRRASAGDAARPSGSAAAAGSQGARTASPRPTHPPMPQPRDPSATPGPTPVQPARQQERRHLPVQTPRYRQGLDSFRNWSQLLDRTGGDAAAMADGGGGSTRLGLTARCALAPRVCLGGEGRVPVDIGVSYLPYRSEQQQQQKDGGGGGGGVDTAVCVAAAYSAGSTNRDTSSRSDGADCRDTGFPWGSTHAAMPRPGTHRGATVVPLDSASKLCRRSPGLALAWVVIPGSATRDGFSSQVTQQRGAGGAAVDEETASIAAAAPDATIDLVVLTPLLCDVELSSFIAHPFRPGVFIGGTRTGRIVMWQVAAEWVNLDRKQLRSRAMATTGSAGTLVWRPQRPCFSTFPSPLSHQAPVLKLAVHGDTSSHSLYSISQDGRVGTWSAWQPAEPLAFRTGYLGSKTIGYTATTAAFASQRGSDAMTKVYVGTVGGTMVQGFNRDGRVVELAYCAGTDPATAASTAHPRPTTSVPAAGGVDSSESSKKNLGVSSSSLGLSVPWAAGGGSLGGGAALATPHHSGPVTAVAVQPQGDMLRECDCVVSAAADGSCIAWLGDTAYSLDNFTAPVTALQWSPTYSALFAAGDEEGLVTLWNVFQSTMAPLFSLSTQHLSMLQPGASSAAAILAVGSNGGGAGGWDGGSLLSMAAAGNMTIVDPVEGAAPAVTSLNFSDDGQWLFAGTAAGNIFVIELGRGLY